MHALIGSEASLEEEEEQIIPRNKRSAAVTNEQGLPLVADCSKYTWVRRVVGGNSPAAGNGSAAWSVRWRP